MDLFYVTISLSLQILFEKDGFWAAVKNLRKLCPFISAQKNIITYLIQFSKIIVVSCFIINYTRIVKQSKP